MTAPLDLNSDVGESFGNWRLGDDDALLRIVTSANVACGFHAGDPTTIRDTCAAAVAGDVAIGAQVGYRDLPGFGRRFIDVHPVDLTADVLYQLGALQGIAAAEGGTVSYVKPHGALYHAIRTNDGQAAAVVDAVRRFDPSLPLLGMPGGRWRDHADDAGLTTVTEAFADRGYTPAGELVSRNEPGAVLTDPDDVAARCVRLATEGVIVAVDGTELQVNARSVCLHGDTPGAVELARAVRAELVAAGVTLRSFG
jgi:5-oxoprolinase (ATP-hydrolysing) subunit A